MLALQFWLLQLHVCIILQENQLMYFYVEIHDQQQVFLIFSDPSSSYSMKLFIFYFFQIF